jgi:protein-L-isoaspartate O-methyltransferase
MTAPARTSWQALLREVPRDAFIPDTIWLDDDSGSGLVAVSKHRDPAAWETAVAANAPVVTQIDLGAIRPDGAGGVPSSSCSQPSIVADMLDALDIREGMRVLEIGTGTGWNAALLARRVGPAGQVTTIEIDAHLAHTARQATAAAGYHPLVITGDGTAGYSDGAPYDRLICTASVRDVVPRAWLDQLAAGGRLVTPWGTDYANGALLTLDLDHSGVATGRFSSDLAFMRLRDQRRALHSWEPAEDAIAAAELTTTECRGSDLDRMLNPAKGKLVIGARLANVALQVEWDKRGKGHHVLELDDAATHSFARLDADLTSPAPFTVRQLGPRRLWDEAEATYDWWYETGAPGPERLGTTITPSHQTIWLDNPTTIVRQWPSQQVDQQRSRRAG